MGAFILNNKTYDILKWVCMVFLPAFITFYGVLGNTLTIPYTDIVMTILGAFDTFLGALLGISNINYRRENGNNEIL